MKAFIKKCPLIAMTIAISLVVAASLAVRGIAIPASNKPMWNQSAPVPPSAASSAPSSAPLSSKKGAGSSSRRPQPVFSRKRSSSSKPPVSSAAVSSEPVAKGYFDDAFFIGDSLTEGFKDYGGLDNAHYFCRVGMSIYQLFEEPKTDPSTGLTLEQTLRRGNYRKIYLLLGINEMGTGSTDYFIRHYSEAISKIRTLQPKAIICIQSIFYVTSSKAAEDPTFSNDKIRVRNKKLEALADGKNIFYLNVNSALQDGKGNLREDYSGDGVHLKAKYDLLWRDYLMKNAVQRKN